MTENAINPFGSSIRFMVEAAEGVNVAVEGVESATDDAAILVFWPAMGVPARFYHPFAEALAKEGIVALVPDIRGQGASSPVVDRRAKFGYHVVASIDFPAVLTAVRERYPSRRVYVGGHSLGGQLAVTFASRHSPMVDGIVLVAASNPYFRVQPVVTAAKVLFATHLIMVVANTYGFWPGNRLGFMGRQSRVMMRDWAHLARTGQLNFVGSDHAVEDELKKTDIPVLSISVAGDNLAPAKAVDRLVAPFPSEQVTRLHHRPLTKVDHIRWVKDSVGIAQSVAKWMRAFNRSG
ncbi:alpha/beta hydrolase family protein [Nocardia camponoti]|uniref:alpha/beta hydrolase family protein n=1 Tax=Nocardia camponoti TaxID=1616106 RepID=UPI0016659A5E|nr:alpha/beta fold hydrolase [Nocardia camponoti]